jgi:tRNA dimethylallyltransferase
MEKKIPKLIIILGPTASGKTDLAIKLAKKFNGEIISADSRQIYKEMDIGTAKPSKKEIKILPHHLINIIKPDQDFNVALYKELVIKATRKIKNKGKIPFLVGGAGLYIKALINNIDFPKVPANKALREKLERKGEKELFKIYKSLDPEGAKIIDRKNKRRLVRAIEVCKITKKPFWQQRKKGERIFNSLIIGIKLPEKELKKRIKTRVEKMFKLGLEKEVKNLTKKYGWDIQPLQTIGYREWKEYLTKRPAITKKELKEKIKLHTIQFTKRQMTWFKKEKRIKWIKNYKEGERPIRNFLEIRT